MVIVQTPFRMSFFGGGTDYPEFYREHGGSVISTTFDKYCYVTARHLPKFFEHSSQVTYSKIENVKSVDEIQHPAVRNTMKYLDMRDLHVGYDADLPARAGLGSSSSFVVGMLNAFYSIKGRYVDKRKLADDAIYVERVLCAENGGIQDQIAAAFGGLNRIDFREDGYSISPVIMDRTRKKELNKRIMLFFTGFSRFSSDIAIEQKKAMKDKTRELIEMCKLVDEAELILTNHNSDLNEFGYLLDYTWKLKRGITSQITTASIDEIYLKARKAGAIGGKLLGAGGGGFMIIYAEPEYQKSVREALSDLLYVPFEFENEGTKVMYYVSEEYEVEK